jgi:hypothetical protein
MKSAQGDPEQEPNGGPGSDGDAGLSSDDGHRLPSDEPEGLVYLGAGDCSASKVDSSPHVYEHRIATMSIIDLSGAA